MGGWRAARDATDKTAQGATRGGAMVPCLHAVEESQASIGPSPSQTHFSAPECSLYLHRCSGPLSNSSMPRWRNGTGCRTRASASESSSHPSRHPQPCARNDAARVLAARGRANFWWHGQLSQRFERWSIERSAEEGSAYRRIVRPPFGNSGLVGGATRPHTACKRKPIFAA